MADSSGDPVESARDGYKRRMRDAWQRDRFVASSGGQVFAGVPDPYHVAESEMVAEGRERGVTP
jgi:hypothetical protein